MSRKQTIERVLNSEINRMRDGIERCQIQQRRKPKDRENLANLFLLRDYYAEYTDALDYVQTMFRPTVAIVKRLREIADQCEAGGHKSRARMFRAVALEMETNFL